MTAHTLPKQMAGVLLTGHGGVEKLEYQDDLSLPVVEDGEVLIRVGACAVNNTDINTRIGWYSKKVSDDTSSGGSAGFEEVDEDDASWSGIPLHFPRIQGADVVGGIVAVGSSVSSERIGERVLIRPMHSLEGDQKKFSCLTFGSECDGGFAQYTKVKHHRNQILPGQWKYSLAVLLPITDQRV